MVDCLEELANRVCQTPICMGRLIFRACLDMDFDNFHSTFRL